MPSGVTLRRRDSCASRPHRATSCALRRHERSPPTRTPASIANSRFASVRARRARSADRTTHRTQVENNRRRAMPFRHRARGDGASTLHCPGHRVVTGDDRLDRCRNENETATNIERARSPNGFPSSSHRRSPSHRFVAPPLDPRRRGRLLRRRAGRGDDGQRAHRGGDVLTVAPELRGQLHPDLR